MLSGAVDGHRFQLEHPFTVQVYAPVIDNTRLWVTNWYSLSPERLAYLNNGELVAPYSDTYWELVHILAENMAEYRQNVALISPLRLAEYTHTEHGLEIDFSRFDRTVNIFIEKGVIGRIEGSHIGRRESHWTSPFVVHVPLWDGEAFHFTPLPISDARAQEFYDVFLPALVEHLESRGWLDIYMQHLADEPIVPNADTYVEIAEYVHERAPALKVIEAVHNKDLAGSVDIWVPQLDFMHEDYAFYLDRMNQGDEAWFYTCLAPQGEYANRFVELPLIKTRLLHWINYRFQIPGYFALGAQCLAWRSF